MKKLDLTFKGSPAEFGILAASVAGQMRMTDKTFALYALSGAPFREDSDAVSLAFGSYAMKWEDLARITVARQSGDQSVVQVQSKDRIWSTIEPNWQLIWQEAVRQNRVVVNTGLPSTDKQRSPKQELNERSETIARLWHEGYKIFDIARKSAVSESTVKRYLKDMKLRRRSSRRKKKQSPP